MRQRIFSGIQPSGDLMLGNYLGAIKNWVNLQDEYECFYCLVNLHAITASQDPQLLSRRSHEFIAWYLACGIDPVKSHIFLQSSVAAHCELAWVLSSITSLGELNRMTQFKEKSQKNEQNLGLLSYPVLMAADILLYDTNLVPVGDDQKQHLELARNLAERFNYKFGQEVFTVPEVYTLKSQGGSRIMSLIEPHKKMSKSDSNASSFILLKDSAKDIEKKIKGATTDSETKIIYDLQNKPAISNLLTIYSAVSTKSIKDLEEEYANKMYGHLKIDLAAVVIEYLKPIQEKYYYFMNNKEILDEVIEKGRLKAFEIANSKLNQVYKIIGLK